MSSVIPVTEWKNTYAGFEVLIVVGTPCSSEKPQKSKPMRSMQYIYETLGFF
jgi:hypothetical protein